MKIKNIIIFCSAIIIIFFSISCVTLYGKQKFTITVSSTPSSSYKITNKKGVQFAQGNTPAQVDLKPGKVFSKEKYRITYSACGYDTVSKKIKEPVNPLFYANIFVGLIWAVPIDLFSGNFWKIKEKEYSKKLPLNLHEHYKCILKYSDNNTEKYDVLLKIKQMPNCEQLFGSEVQFFYLYVKELQLFKSPEFVGYVINLKEKGLFDETLYSILDTEAYNSARKSLKISDFTFYLTYFQDGTFSSEAQYNYDVLEKINKIEIVEELQNYVKTISSLELQGVAYERIELLCFERAEKKHTISAYSEFISLYPKSQYVADAYKSIDEIIWQSTKNKNTIVAFSQYITKYPDSKYLNEAIQLRENLRWRDVLEKNTIAAYSDFITKYPESNYTKLALYKIDYLKYRNLLKTMSLHDFVKQYPDNSFTSLSYAYLLRTEILTKTNNLNADEIIVLGVATNVGVDWGAGVFFDMQRRFFIPEKIQNELKLISQDLKSEFSFTLSHTYYNLDILVGEYIIFSCQRISENCYKVTDLKVLDDFQYSDYLYWISKLNDCNSAINLLSLGFSKDMREGVNCYFGAVMSIYSSIAERKLNEFHEIQNSELLK